MFMKKVQYDTNVESETPGKWLQISSADFGKRLPTCTTVSILLRPLSLSIVQSFENGEEGGTETVEIIHLFVVDGGKR